MDEFYLMYVWDSNTRHSSVPVELENNKGDSVVPWVVEQKVEDDQQSFATSSPTVPALINES
jgi:hypothetical protein